MRSSASSSSFFSWAGVAALGPGTTGQRVTVYHGGAYILTNGANVILPGAANILTKSGDISTWICTAASTGTAQWTMLTFVPATGSGLPFGGSPFLRDAADGTKQLNLTTSGITTGTTRTWTVPDSNLVSFVVQRVSTITGAAATGTTAIGTADTIPTISLGDQYMSLAITPKNTANILKIEVSLMLANTNASSQLSAILIQDSTTNALASVNQATSTASFMTNLKFTHVMTAGTTSATTFKIRGGAQAGATTTFNGSAGARIHGGVLSSSMVITEYSS